MTKASCWIMSCLLIFSFSPCATGAEKKPFLSPMGYEMSKKLKIDNPDEYWTIDWGELDKDEDGYLSKDEFIEAYPEHGKEAFQYFDHNGDGWVSMQEWFDMYN